MRERLLYARDRAAKCAKNGIVVPANRFIAIISCNTDNISMLRVWRIYRRNLIFFITSLAVLAEYLIVFDTICLRKFYLSMFDVT